MLLQTSQCSHSVYKDRGNGEGGLGRCEVAAETYGSRNCDIKACFDNLFLWEHALEETQFMLIYKLFKSSGAKHCKYKTP